MAYYLGRDVSVTLGAGEEVGVDGANLVFTGAGTDFCSMTDAGLAVSDLTGVDLSIGVTDEDITYMGGKTVLKAEIKKETTVSLTRKKKDNTWDVVFNGDGTPDSGARWGAYNSAGILNLAGEPNMLITTLTGSTVNYFGYQIKVHLVGGSTPEVFTVPHCQITGHTVSLNADGTTEETMEFISQETPSIGAT